MIVKDPQQLLPNFSKDFCETLDSVIEIPTHGIPLHPKSLEKLLFIAKEKNSIVVFQPTLSILSELGLPVYPILAYLYPQELNHIWEQLQPKIETLLKSKDFSSIPFTLISQIDRDEQGSIPYWNEYKYL